MGWLVDLGLAQFDRALLGKLLKHGIEREKG